VLKQKINRYRWERDLTTVLGTSTQPAKLAQAYAANLVTGVTTLIAIIAIALFPGQTQACIALARYAYFRPIHAQK